MILEREPAWAALPAATPARIRQLLAKCLAKDPKQRQRDIGDVRIEIDAINEGISGAADLTATVPASGRRYKTWLPWAVVAAIMGGILREMRRPAASENPLAAARFSRLTDWAGTEGQAEITRRQVRGLSRRPCGAVRPLVESGRHVEVHEPDERRRASIAQ